MANVAARFALGQEQEVEDLDRERDEAGERGNGPGEGAPDGGRQGDVLKATAKAASVLRSGGAIRAATAAPPADRTASAAITTPSVSAVTSFESRPLNRPPPRPKQMTTTLLLTRPRRTRCGMRAICGCSARASTAGATRPAPSVSAIGPSPTSSPAAR